MCDFIKKGTHFFRFNCVIRNNETINKNQYLSNLQENMLNFFTFSFY